MTMRNILVAVVFFSGWCAAQTTLSTHAMFSRIEVFHSMQCNVTFSELIDVEAQLGVGARSAYLQGSIRPMAGLFLGYDLLKKNEHLSVVPKVGGLFVDQHIGETEVVNSEWALGYTLSWGHQVRVLHGALIGMGSERVKTVHSSGVFRYTSYCITLGIGYVF
jgi:hypothetical protein